MPKLKHLLIAILPAVVAISAQETPAQYEFMKSIYENKMAGVKKALADGIDINLKDPNGDMGSHLTALTCNLPMLKFLAGKGLRLNDADARGKTALTISLEKGSYFMALANRKPYNDCEQYSKFLIDNLPDGFLGESGGDNLLINAVEASYVSHTEKLLKKGANVNFQDRIGNTALMRAMTPMTFEAMPRNIQIAKTLIRYKADKTLKNKEGKTAWAILNEDKGKDQRMQNALLKLLEP